MPSALLSKQASHHRELPDSSEFLGQTYRKRWRVMHKNLENYLFRNVNSR